MASRRGSSASRRTDRPHFSEQRRAESRVGHSIDRVHRPHTIGARRRRRFARLLRNDSIRDAQSADGRANDHDDQGRKDDSGDAAAVSRGAAAAVSKQQNDDRRSISNLEGERRWPSSDKTCDAPTKSRHFQCAQKCACRAELADLRNQLNMQRSSTKMTKSAAEAEHAKLEEHLQKLVERVGALERQLRAIGSGVGGGGGDLQAAGASLRERAAAFATNQADFEALTRSAAGNRLIDDDLISQFNLARLAGRQLNAQQPLNAFSSATWAPPSPRPSSSASGSDLGAARLDSFLN